MAAVLDQQLRNGTFASSSLAVPQGARVFSVDSTMSPEDVINPLLACILYAEFSYDGKTFVSFQSTAWQGAVLDKFGQPNTVRPGIGITIPGPDANGTPIQSVRVSLDTVGTPINMGLTISFR